MDWHCHFGAFRAVPMLHWFTFVANLSEQSVSWREVGSGLMLTNINLKTRTQTSAMKYTQSIQWGCTGPLGWSANWVAGGWGCFFPLLIGLLPGGCGFVCCLFLPGGCGSVTCSCPGWVGLCYMYLPRVGGALLHVWVGLCYLFLPRGGGALLLDVPAQGG